MNWMLMPYRRYFDFSGRSRRMEYWMFYLFVTIVYVVLAVVSGAGAASIDPATGQMAGGGGLATVGFALLMLFWLGTIIPALAVSIRRMHDQDRSGWWIICPIANVIFLFIDGTPGPNRFGEDPKGR